MNELTNMFRWMVKPPNAFPLAPKQTGDLFSFTHLEQVASVERKKLVVKALIIRNLNSMALVKFG